MWAVVLVVLVWLWRARENSLAIAGQLGTVAGISGSTLQGGTFQLEDGTHTLASDPNQIPVVNYRLPVGGGGFASAPGAPLGGGHPVLGGGGGYRVNPRMEQTT